MLDEVRDENLEELVDEDEDWRCDCDDDDDDLPSKKDDNDDDDWLSFSIAIAGFVAVLFCIGIVVYFIVLGVKKLFRKTFGSLKKRNVASA